MATEVKMPQLGLTMEEGTIGKWIKQVGDTVKKGDVIVEITTDKLSTEIESEVDGTLLAIKAQEGEDIPVKGLIAIIGDADEKINIDSESSKEDVKTENVAEPLKQEQEVVSQSSEKTAGGRIKVSPLAKKTAAKLGVELSGLVGSGSSGRIVQKDVFSAKEQVAAAVPVEATVQTQVEVSKSRDIIKPLTSMRKVIGKRMTESKHNAPHVTITTEANVDKTVALRSKLNTNREVRFSYTDILVKMSATALRSVPMINSSIDGNNIIMHDDVNIGVAVALDDGLIVPVVRDADRKGLDGICKDTKDLISKARGNKLSGDELAGATFTISNLGGYDIDAFTPIINLPESCILGVGRIVRKPIVNKNDEIVPASMMVLSLSFDHRIVDGALAAQFLKKIKNYLEDPDQMYL